MRIIKTQQDFAVLRRTGTLPVELLDQIEDYFRQLRAELMDDEAEKKLRLGRQG